ATARARDVLVILEGTLSLMKDAETGQRGFIITGNPSYLLPYDSALRQIDDQLARLQSLTADDPRQQSRIPALKKGISARLQTLKEGITARNSESFDAARAIIESNRGKTEMDEVRTQIGEMIAIEQELHRERLDRSAEQYRTTITTNLISDGIA